MAETYFVRNFDKKSSPFIGALLGLVFFFGSFVLIYKNEGRINLADFAEKATPMVVGGSYTDGQLVAVTGEVTTEEEVGDDLFKKPEKYVSLRRDVEMYAWTESSKDRDGGTEYTYDTEWTDYPSDSSMFEVKTGHENPEMPFNSQTFTPEVLTINAVVVQGQELSLPAHTQTIELSSENTELKNTYGTAALAEDGSEIYIKNPKVAVTDEVPHVGDIRVTYKAIPLNSLVTVFGSYRMSSGVQSIESYKATQALKGSTTLYDMRYGTKDVATDTLGTEYKTLLWALRILGFVLMLMGLNMILSPLTALFGYIPVIGQIGRFILELITFVTVIVLYIVTLFISMVVHNVIALVLAVIVVLAIAVFVAKRFGNKQQTMASTTTTSPQTPTPLTPPQA